jgi:hypothetical protein
MMNLAQRETPDATASRDELIDELKRWTTDYFGYPTRQANLDSWGRMEAGQLRVVHANWKKLMMRPRLVRGCL